MSFSDSKHACCLQKFLLYPLISFPLESFGFVVPLLLMVSYPLNYFVICLMVKGIAQYLVYHYLTIEEKIILLRSVYYVECMIILPEPINQFQNMILI